MAKDHVALMIRERVVRYGDRVALRHKAGPEWAGVSWRSLGEQADSAARALVELGLPELANVGICSPNRPEWTVADLGALTARCVPVPIYPTSSSKQIIYILKEAEIPVLFVGGRSEYEKALSVAQECPQLKRIVVFDPSCEIRGGLSCHFGEFLQTGRMSAAGPEVEARLSRVEPEDLLTIIYTSGTTGEPKGVMLTHANLFACFRGHDRRLVGIGEADLSLCFLPLSHVFERCWTYNTLYMGMTNFYLEDPTQVVQAMQEVRPTVMCGVPRVYEKAHAGILGRLHEASRPRQRLFWWAMGVGKEAGERMRQELPLPFTLKLKHRLADALVLKKIRALVGGRVRMLPCAGAPLAKEIEEFFQATGLFICHGYGLTETTATVSCHEFTHFKPGTVGKPLPGVEVRIAEDGEILVRGGTVMRGYYKKPRETAEAFTDGWLRTGDAGMLDGDGCLTITDRLKDLMKTSAGKYVAPQQIEMAIGGDPFIEQVCAIGDNRRFVSALLVPNFEVLERFAATRGVTFTSREELCTHPVVTAFYREKIDARTKDLARHEQVKKFMLLPKAFSIEDGDLTPTLKVKRKLVEGKYRDLIEAMYAE